MEYFIINLTICIIFFILVIGKDVIEKKLIYYFIGLLFIIFLGLRGSNDEYTQLFIRIPTLPSFFSNLYVMLERGPLFAFIASALKSMGLNSQSLLFFFAFSSIALRLKYYSKFSQYYLIAFLFYLSHEVIFHEYWQIRQGLSSAMVLPMIYHLQNRNNKMFFLFYIISSLIHYAGFLSILLLFINKRIKIKWLLLGLCLAFAINFSGIVGQSLSYLFKAGYLPLVLQNYLGWEYHNYNLGFLHPKTFQQIITCLLLLFILNDSNRFYSKSISHMIINTYILSTIFQVAFNQHAIFATRLGGHFYVVEPIIITYFISLIKEKKLMLSFTTFLCIFLSYINYMIRTELQPYQFLVQ